MSNSGSNSGRRLVVACVAAAAWVVSLPMVAGAILDGRQTAASYVLVPAALVMAGIWWLHLRERSTRIGTGGGMAGWLFIGAVALLGVAGFIWILVAMALLAAAVAYGVILLVTQQRAPNPPLELATGLLLFATGCASVIFVLTAGLQQSDVWWLPAHWFLAIGLGAATIVGAIPTSVPDEDASPASVSRP